MRKNSIHSLGAILIGLAIGIPNAWSAPQDSKTPTGLTLAGQKLELRYARQLAGLQAELASKIPSEDAARGESLDQFLSSDTLDAKFSKFVVLHDATPAGLAEFAQQGPQYESLVERLLGDPLLMKQMVVADGARFKPIGRTQGPAQYGPAMQIYHNIQQASGKSSDGILQRLALAVSLEHSVPISQSNPQAQTQAPETINPVNRYLHYEKAFLDGELDPAFEMLTTWELRMVVNGDEPDETLAWGREMLRNYRPDHIHNSNFGWRYVSIVTSDVKYGSENVKHDRPELQKYQNILMNGGVCGRRAFFGRFILRAFGVPTIARPSRGHGALAHWTPDGWTVNLGGAWGCGWTKTLYKQDVDFLASTQARTNGEAFLKVKRAQWAGDVMGEQRSYGEGDGNHGFWNQISLRVQREIIDQTDAVTLDALGEDLGEADEPAIAEKIRATPVKPADKQIKYLANGVISIPAAAYSKPSGNTRDVIAMNSFDGGLQIFLPRFFPQGQTIMRGGTWKGEPNACTSGIRMLSGGYGRYENWGLRAAMTPSGDDTPDELTLDLGGGITLDLVYIPPGTFVMGGESETEGRFQCIEVPQHEVTISKGFYLGKYEVTQAQYERMMGKNPSKSTKGPDVPVDNVSEADARSFCGKVAELTGHDVRLPTEAEWEYASRAGRDTKWFFGDAPGQLGDYAWFKDNANARSHPVGQKKPNPWGLYDIYGNVCERISDKYARNYYSISPAVDPTGPSEGTKSQLEYQIEVPRAGKYLLTALVVTANYNQRINVATNGADSPITIEMPFTGGDWQESKPVLLTLRKGRNTLKLYRNQPPQYGVAVKQFKLTPAN